MDTVEMVWMHVLCVHMCRAVLEKWQGMTSFLPPWKTRVKELSGCWSAAIIVSAGHVTTSQTHARLPACTCHLYVSELAAWQRSGHGCGKVFHQGVFQSFREFNPALHVLWYVSLSLPVKLPSLWTCILWQLNDIVDSVECQTFSLSVTLIKLRYVSTAKEPLWGITELFWCFSGFKETRWLCL